MVLVADETDKVTFSFAPAANETLASTEGNLLKGVCRSGVARDATTTTYVLNGNRQTGTIGFYKYTATNLPAYKAYLEIPASQENAPGFLFDFGGQTSIVPVLPADEAAGPCYDLSGRRIAKPTRGLYIQGGRKIFVK